MAEKQHPSAKFIGAGIELLKGGLDVTQLSAEPAIAATGLSGADFSASFADRESYWLAILRQLLDDARKTAHLATADLPAGMVRAKQGLNFYWDHNLSHPWLRRVLIALQPYPPAVQYNSIRVKGWAMVFQVEYTSLGIPNAQAAAQLTVSMAVEVAYAEHEAGRQLPELRETLFAYLDHIAA